MRSLGDYAPRSLRDARSFESQLSFESIGLFSFKIYKLAFVRTNCTVLHTANVNICGIFCCCFVYFYCDVCTYDDHLFIHTFNGLLIYNSRHGYQLF